MCYGARDRQSDLAVCARAVHVFFCASDAFALYFLQGMKDSRFVKCVLGVLAIFDVTASADCAAATFWRTIPFVCVCQTKTRRCRKKACTYFIRKKYVFYMCFISRLFYQEKICVLYVFYKSTAAAAVATAAFRSAICSCEMGVGGGSGTASKLYDTSSVKEAPGASSSMLALLTRPGSTHT